MRIIKTAVIMLILSQALYASAESTAQRLPQGVLYGWITYYYLHPDPDKTRDAVLTLHYQGNLHERAAAPVASFLSFVFKQNPYAVRGWYSDWKGFSPLEKKTIWYGLWYSDSPQAKELLEDILKEETGEDKAILESLIKRKPASIADMEIVSPAVLDILWGAFMATGDERYVIRIMSALPYVNVRDDVDKLLIGGAARWSLASNAVQHERVMEICRQQELKQAPEIRAILLDIIREAERAGESRAQQSNPE